MTFRDVEIEERQVRIVLGHRVRVVLERGRRVRVTQLIGNPLDVLTSLNRPCRPGVARRVERELPNSEANGAACPEYYCDLDLAARLPWMRYKACAQCY